MPHPPPSGNPRGRVLVSATLGAFLFYGYSLTPAWAATDDDAVTVGVPAVNLVSLPPTAALTLTTSTPGAIAYDQGTLDQLEGLKLSHNNPDGVLLTLEAIADPANGPNDITLALDVFVLVLNGSLTGPQDFPGSIPAGGFTGDIPWTVDGTLAGTASGSYIWTVTITSTDL